MSEIRPIAIEDNSDPQERILNQNPSQMVSKLNLSSMRGRNNYKSTLAQIANYDTHNNSHLSGSMLNQNVNQLANNASFMYLNESYAYDTFEEKSIHNDVGKGSIMDMSVISASRGTQRSRFKLPDIKNFK